MMELVALMAVFALAVALRLPYLWEIPRFTDEVQEVLWSLSIARGEILPLTAVDSYYGPAWSYLLAALFVVLGPDPYLPRLVAMLLGAALVVVTYLFARDVAGRWPAAIAAGLVLSSGGHIVINSHTARSNSITPLLTTAALWLFYRALEDRVWAGPIRQNTWRRPRPWLLVPTGMLLGLAMQTHLSVIALAPGLAAYLLRRGHGLLGSPWPYLAGLAGIVGYVNMIVYNLQTGFWSYQHARSLQEGYTAGRPTDLDSYFTNLGSLIQSLSRLLSGTIDTPDSPTRFIYMALACVGLLLLARRGGLLLGLAATSMILVLPYFNPRYGPILSGRYLIPLLPIAFVAIGYVAVAAAMVSAQRAPLLRKLGWQRVAAVLGLALALYPLLPLYRYYQEAVVDGRTNRPLHQLFSTIVAERTPHETVLLDEGLNQEQLGAGGTDLKAFRMLLGTGGIPHEVAKVTDVDEIQAPLGPSVLFLLEAKKRTSLPRSISATLLGAEVVSASGSGHRYAVYRLTSR
jgi:glycosyltransferase AglD